MANIFISYSHLDKAYASSLAIKLREHNQTVYFDQDLNPGDSWRSHLSEKLGKSDVFITILSNASASAAYPMAEVGRALGMAESTNILILPIAIDDVSIPTLLQDRLFLRAEGRPLDDYFPQILGAISAFESRREEQAQRLVAVERDLSDFVEDAISQQRVYEKKNKAWAVTWHIIGVTSLLVVAGVAGFSIHNAMSSNDDTAKPIELFNLISTMVLNFVLVGVMAALARLSYSLAQSYMSESLKSSDRIHAIQFGKFFLKAYGSRLSPAEVKEAFQHWNIDRNSTFAAIDSSHVDPQIYSLVAQLIGAVSRTKQ